MPTSTIIPVEQEELEVAISNLLEALADTVETGEFSLVTNITQATRNVTTVLPDVHPYQQPILDLVQQVTSGDLSAKELQRRAAKLSDEFLRYISGA